MRRMIALTLAVSLLAISGCATTANRETMLKSTAGFVSPQPVRENAALVYVVRPSGGGEFVRFNIFVDDPDQKELEAGYTRGGQYIYF